MNALRSHLYEFGHVAPEGIGYVPRLAKVVDDPGTDIPELARDICRMLLEQNTHLTDRINALKARIAGLSNEAESRASCRPCRVWARSASGCLRELSTSATFSSNRRSARHAEHGAPFKPVRVPAQRQLFRCRRFCAATPGAMARNAGRTTDPIG